jgi:peptidoglycan hydrolase CwlO-like protein
MAKHSMVMESSASIDGDLDIMDEQLEMLAQNIKKGNGEVHKLQKENERMEKKLEETQNQLVNQIEKAFYEKN